MLLVAILAAGCGGGGAGSSTCTVGSSAGCGGTLPPPTSPDGGSPSPSDPSAKVAGVSVVTSSSDLPSSGLPDGEVTVTALVKSADNVGVAGAKVEFSADSGLLSVASATTDTAGKAMAKLGTGGSPANRPIKVSVKSGTQAGSATVYVSGTHLTFNAPASLSVGASASAVATLLDSADRPIPGAAVSGNARIGNGIALGGSQTDSKGQVSVQLTGSAGGSEEFTLSALGASVTKVVAVSGGEVVLQPAIMRTASGADVLKEVAMGSCTPVTGTSTTASGTISYSTSRGTLYTDAACSTPAGAALAYSAGKLPGVWLKVADAGIATVDGLLASGGRGSTRIEFVAPLRPTARVDLQADQAVVGPGESSNLVAIVRDGTAANNLVKNATVEFSIVSDPSAGALLTPLAVTTGSDGVARTSFIGGPNPGGKNGTVIQARIAELPTATSSTALTVLGKAISIQFGTGNKVGLPSPEVREMNFAVFVSDQAGNPVKDATVSAAAWVLNYGKGSFYWQKDKFDQPDFEPGRWVQSTTDICANEDSPRKGIFEKALDTNGNGVLDPGVPLTVTVSGKTDTMGMATVTVRYPSDRAYWNQVQLTVSGTVAGTEATPRSVVFDLLGVIEDYRSHDVAPAGRWSPYGLSSCSLPN
jgi:hypothetical protein